FCLAARTSDASSLSLHDALPIWDMAPCLPAPLYYITRRLGNRAGCDRGRRYRGRIDQIQRAVVVMTREARCMARRTGAGRSTPPDRKSTRLNSSHVKTSYAVFCL